jgi:hypothetical protein
MRVAGHLIKKVHADNRFPLAALLAPPPCRQLLQVPLHSLKMANSRDGHHHWFSDISFTKKHAIGAVPLKALDSLTLIITRAIQKQKGFVARAHHHWRSKNTFRKVPSFLKHLLSIQRGD